MTNEKKSNEVPSSSRSIEIVGTVGALSSLGNFAVNIMGGGEMGQFVWLQLLPFGAFLFAFLLALVDFEMRRDKWPGRLRELTQRVILVSAVGKEDYDPVARRAIVVIYKEFYRMALAEGKKELAKDLKKEISWWEKD